MWFGVITLFPDMLNALNVGMTGQALKKNLIQLHTVNPRVYTYDKHQSVDDRPYGGGPGMVMMFEPLQAAIHAAQAASPETTKTPVIYLSPQGKKIDQSMLFHWSKQPAMILLAGRYEGVDERLIEQEVDEIWSIGDYILTGGELPAMVVIDAISRLIPGVVGDPASITDDSITTGLLEYPHYTSPEEISGASVPASLLSGHHQKIKEWRLKQSLGRTWLKRPDLLIKRGLSDDELLLLSAYLEEFFKK